MKWAGEADKVVLSAVFCGMLAAFTLMILYGVPAIIGWLNGMMP